MNGCGFHLQGSMANKLPPQMHTLYIETTTPYDAFILKLKNTLKAEKINVVSSADQAPITLDITAINKTSSTFGNQNSTETANAYTLFYIINYVLKGADGSVIMPPQTIHTSEVISLPANTMFDNSNLPQTSYENMENILIQKLLTQLSSKNTIAAVTQYQQSSQTEGTKSDVTDNSKQTNDDSSSSPSN